MRMFGMIDSRLCDGCPPGLSLLPLGVLQPYQSAMYVYKQYKHHCMSTTAGSAGDVLFLP